MTTTRGAVTARPSSTKGRTSTDRTRPAAAKRVPPPREVASITAGLTEAYAIELSDRSGPLTAVKVTM
ncbi:hypothetical protein [Streptomyces atratus]|uniref:hypothetical protein n=1 Tax=Streptomyces atratus TaxID=1893 RepID=UPI0021A9060D|nr:hypothetical protein [Streptomyces atratus]MCT2548413.1 hypothetical protein [Streptomyces atratus]